jgi:hypothetical protein
MNTLSQILYAADVLSSVSLALGLISCVLFIIMLIISGMSVFAWLEIDKVKAFPYKLNYLWLVFILMATLSALIPTKNTMYAIAASEMGEDVFKSRVGQKSLAAVELWIDKQLEQPK